MHLLHSICGSKLMENSCYLHSKATHSLIKEASYTYPALLDLYAMPRGVLLQASPFSPVIVTKGNKPTWICFSGAESRLQLPDEVRLIPGLVQQASLRKLHVWAATVVIAHQQAEQHQEDELEAEQKDRQQKSLHLG